MNRISTYLALTSIACSGVLASASALRKGDSAGIFYVTKVSGAAEDGVSSGEELCYRCRYGASPMVIVFTRSAGPQVKKLAKQIDKLIEKRSDHRLRGLVTFIGKDLAEVKDKANEFGQSVSPTHVPIVIAKDTETGPENYKLDGSDVTVIVAIDSKVIVSRTFEEDAIDFDKVNQDIENMLKMGS